MLSVCRKLLSVSFNEWSLGTSSITEEARLGEFESVADFFNTSFLIFFFGINDSFPKLKSSSSNPSNICCCNEKKKMVSNNFLWKRK